MKDSVRWREKIYRVLVAKFFLVGGFSSLVFAEPWIANRVTKNCASCHSPGRINLQTKERRCTLTCQGCHVNPNGGGLRNKYGEWYQDRWLQSLSFKKWNAKKPPAPYIYQKYGEGNKEKFEEKLRADSGIDKMQFEGLKKFIDAASGEKTIVAEIGEFAASQHVDKTNHKKMAVSREQFEEQIPQDDPYYLERERKVYASGDLRYLSYSSDDGAGNKTDASWPMSAEIGLRYRPSIHNISLVMESRFLNQPSNKELTDLFTTESRVRSAYVLVDDLAYNSHFMYGLYRPMFGLYDPNHTTLRNVVAGFSQRDVFKGLSLGAAPNVPFFNIHLLDSGDSNTISDHSGIVASAGARFVSYGASAVFSYWNTDDGNGLNRTMYALTLGAKLWRIISNIEFLRVEDEFSSGSFDKGFMYTIQEKIHLWRENYAVLNYSSSNVARTLKEGSGSEISIGIKSFLLSNLELEGLIIKQSDEVNSNQTNTDILQFQVHLFF